MDKDSIEKNDKSKMHVETYPEDVKSIIEQSDQDQAKSPEEEIPAEEPKRVNTEKTISDDKSI